VVPAKRRGARRAAAAVVESTGEVVQTEAIVVAPVEVSALTPAEAELQQLDKEAREVAARAIADSTKRAYTYDWWCFSSWCEAHRVRALPASVRTLRAYIRHMAKSGFKAATIRRALMTIGRAHRHAGQEPATADEKVLVVLHGTLKDIGVVQKAAQPFFPEDLRKAHLKLGDGLRGIRDRALSALCFTGAFRRSEVVSLDVADLDFRADGNLMVILRRSKTDQLGAGRKVPISRGRYEETCPVRTVQAWLAAAGITEGAIFRSFSRHGKLTDARASYQTVHRLAKEIAALAELPNPESYSGHSFRAGFVTTANRLGKSESKIMDVTGHRDRRTLQRYIRDTELFKNNASDDIGM
jgi:site-specific recombinase XerD